MTVLVITDPPGTIPVLLALTRNRPVRRQRRAAWQAVVVAFSVIVACALFDQQVPDCLDVSPTALPGAGVLLLPLLALQLFSGQEAAPDAAGSVNVAFVPLGSPLLAGPSTIIATLLVVRRIPGVADVVAVAAGIVAGHVVAHVVLRFSGLIQRLPGADGETLSTQTSGLLLAAIAVQLAVQFIADSVPASGRCA